MAAKVKELPASDNRVIIIDDKTGDIREALGITPERSKELQKSVQIAYHSSDKMTDAAELYSKDCKHPNELFYCTTVVFQIHQKMEMMSTLERIMSGRHRDR